MYEILKKRFTKEVCDQVLGTDACWWKNFNGSCQCNMKLFYNMVGGDAKQKLNIWVITVLFEDGIKLVDEKDTA